MTPVAETPSWPLFTPSTDVDGALVSVVVPVHNEVGAVTALAHEIAATFAGQAHEIIFVDDASSDDTLPRLKAVMSDLRTLRVLSHSRNAGQSRAIRTGVLAARGGIIVTMDGDGQNPPRDASALIEMLRQAPADVALVGGRRASRQDSRAKRRASVWANRIRRRLLGDDADDTGCGLKAFRREAYLQLPYFDHMHRYLPALMIREGYRNLYRDVGHRHRETGHSKYTNWGRLRASVADLAGVLWLKARCRPTGPIHDHRRE